MSATMPMVVLPRTKLSVSRFIFGTASLFNVGNQGKRLQLLEAAVHAGFTHFDTAPYYGFGWAEKDLGVLLQRHPQVTVTTKVGIYSPGGESASESSVFWRKVAGRVIKAASRPTVDFSLKRAQAMLHTSLARLRARSIALYMLHEPELRMVQTDEWQRWLETEVGRGRIQAFGLASTREQLLPFLEDGARIAPVIQMLDSIDDQESDCLRSFGHPLQITYGYVSAARKKQPNLSVTSILQSALARNAAGAIIVSTTKPDRLAQYSRLFPKEAT